VLRDAYPDLLRGMAVAEEAQDIPTPAATPTPAPAPAQTLSRTDQAKAKLLADRQRKAIVESIAKSGAMPPLDVDPETGEVLPELTMAERIASASSPEELEALRPDIQALQNGEKTAAISAWKARKAELTAA